MTYNIKNFTKEDVVISNPDIKDNGMLTGNINSKIKVKHIKTGIEVIEGQSRYRHINKEIALKKLDDVLRKGN